MLVSPVIAAVEVRLVRLIAAPSTTGTLAPVKVIVLAPVTAAEEATTSMPLTLKCAVKVPDVVTGSDSVTTNVKASPVLPRFTPLAAVPSVTVKL